MTSLRMAKEEEASGCLLLASFATSQGPQTCGESMRQAPCPLRPGSAARAPGYVSHMHGDILE